MHTTVRVLIKIAGANTISPRHLCHRRAFITHVTAGRRALMPLSAPDTQSYFLSDWQILTHNRTTCFNCTICLILGPDLMSRALLPPAAQLIRHYTTIETTICLLPVDFFVSLLWLIAMDINGENMFSQSSSGDKAELKQSSKPAVAISTTTPGSKSIHIVEDQSQ